MLLFQTELVSHQCRPLLRTSRHTVDISSYTPRITGASTPRWNIGTSPFTQWIQNHALILYSDQSISHNIKPLRGIRGTPVVACRGWFYQVWTSAVRVDTVIVAVGDASVVLVIPFRWVVAVVVFEIYVKQVSRLASSKPWFKSADVQSIPHSAKAWASTVSYPRLAG